MCDEVIDHKRTKKTMSAIRKLRASGHPALASGFARFNPFRLAELKKYKAKYGHNPGGEALKKALKRASVAYHKCYGRTGKRKYKRTAH